MFESKCMYLHYKLITETRSNSCAKIFKLKFKNIPSNLEIWNVWKEDRLKNEKKENCTKKLHGHTSAHDLVVCQKHFVEYVNFPPFTPQVIFYLCLFHIHGLLICWLFSTSFHTLLFIPSGFCMCACVCMFECVWSFAVGQANSSSGGEALAFEVAAMLECSKLRQISY